MTIKFDKLLTLTSIELWRTRICWLNFCDKKVWLQFKLINNVDNNDLVLILKICFHFDLVLTTVVYLCISDLFSGHLYICCFCNNHHSVGKTSEKYIVFHSAVLYFHTNGIWDILSYYKSEPSCLAFAVCVHQARKGEFQRSTVRNNCW